jgi:uncharacterized RDD family membrane protein YckC
MENATLGKRLLAILYDVLIVFLFILVISLITQQIIIQSGLIELEQVPISETESVFVIPADSIANAILKSLWLILSFLYFGYYWTKRGQTPGMKVWKLKVVNHDGTLISWIQAILRYLSAFFGFGLLWSIFNNKHRATQDVLSKSVIIKV